MERRVTPKTPWCPRQRRKRRRAANVWWSKPGCSARWGVIPRRCFTTSRPLSSSSSRTHHGRSDHSPSHTALTPPRVTLIHRGWRPRSKSARMRCQQRSWEMWCRRPTSGPRRANPITAPPGPKELAPSRGRRQRIGSALHPPLLPEHQPKLTGALGGSLKWLRILWPSTCGRLLSLGSQALRNQLLCPCR